MSKVFKNLKNLFIVSDPSDGRAKGDEVTPAVEEQSSMDQVEVSPVETSTPLSSSNAFESPDGEVNDRFLNVLFGALEKANLEGFDYFEYKQALQNMRKMNMDESTMYKSAFASAQIMGATPDLLNSSARHYLEVLDEEERKFEDAWKNQAQNNIDKKVTSKTKLAESIKMKSERIAKLKEEINVAEDKLSTVDEEIQTMRLKVNKTRNDFIASWKFLTDQIKEDISKMSNYLK